MGCVRYRVLGLGFWVWGSKGSEGSEGRLPFTHETISIYPLAKKVHRFGLLPFTIILTDRLDKVLKILMFLASASGRKSLLAVG